MSGIEIFKEISFGGLSKDDLIQKLAQANIQFNSYAHQLFAHHSFVVPDNSTVFKLVKVNLLDLKISNPCSFGEIIRLSIKLGLKQCPLALGAFFRLAYLGQPEGPYLTIASIKPEQDENFPNGFYVRNTDNALWLRGYRASDDYRWPTESEFIFIKPS